MKEITICKVSPFALKVAGVKTFRKSTRDEIQSSVKSYNRLLRSVDNRTRSMFQSSQEFQEEKSSDMAVTRQKLFLIENSKECYTFQGSSELVVPLGAYVALNQGVCISWHYDKDWLKSYYSSFSTKVTLIG